MSVRFLFARTMLVCLITLSVQSCAGLSPQRSERHGLLDGSPGRTVSSRNPFINKPKGTQQKEQKANAVAASPVASARLIGAQFHWPLKKNEITSSFGRRGGDFHEGIDLRAQVGTPIYAAQVGQVIYAGSTIRGYGKMIVIRHPGGLATVYAHASKVLVTKGQQVKAAQKIAISGQTGRVTGPHLHFEIRSGVVAVNPSLYLLKTPFAVATETATSRQVRNKSGERVALVSKNSASKQD